MALPALPLPPLARPDGVARLGRPTRLPDEPRPQHRPSARQARRDDRAAGAEGVPVRHDQPVRRQLRRPTERVELHVHRLVTTITRAAS